MTAKSQYQETIPAAGRPTPAGVGAPVLFSGSRAAANSKQKAEIMKTKINHGFTQMNTDEGKSGKRGSGKRKWRIQEI
ncbi:MAG: hypothetical protein ABSE16_11025 [Verrucomicrobiota bacterium]|jgi:hypothetical protein